MASTVVDSILFRDAFGTRKMRRLFSDDALVSATSMPKSRWPSAQARVGVIPKEAAKSSAANPNRADRLRSHAPS
jgi:3-carboxy-cis,cis-muconate cycloisomerase